MSLLTNIFNLTIYNVDEFKYYFDSKINIKYFKELVYDNINNFQYVVDEILKLLNDINKIESSNLDLEGSDKLSDEDIYTIEESKE